MGQPAKLGRYELRETLGRGAMGVVYEGFDPVLGRRVAIKTILPNAALGEDVVRDYAMRFTREAKAAARLSHPNIVQVYDFGAQDDLSYLVMEYVDGTELGKFFESGELFDIQDVTRLMTQLLEALELAHNAGIVHRDIKPANVMVDSDGQAKLADFGVARVSDGQDATQVGSMVGTPAYMSPEQVQGQPVDRRTDIFSAGVILYQFLTGQKPFQGGGAYTLARKIIHDDPVMPSALVPSISPAYDRVIRRALAKGVDERYQTAREFSQALNALMSASAPDAPDDDSTRKISSADMPKAAPVAVAATTTTAQAQPESLASGLELEFWRAVKDSEEVDDFELYLTKFPSGVYAELAQRKVAKLKRVSTAAAEEAATLKRQLEEEARARREAEEAAKRAAEEKAKLEAQARAQAQRAVQLKREAEAEAAGRRAAEAAAAAAVQNAAAAQVTKPAVVPATRASAIPAAQTPSRAEPAKSNSMVIPAVIGVLVLAGAAGAFFAMKPKAPVEVSSPVAPVPAPAQAVAPAKPEPQVAQPAVPPTPAPVADEKKPAEKSTREIVKAAPAPAQVAKPGTDAVGKAAASKAAADAAAAKAAADIAAAKSTAEQAAAQSAAAAAAAEQRAAAAEQRAAAAEKSAADRAAADKAAAEKASAEKAAAVAKGAASGADSEALAARRVARAKELEWTKGGPTGSKPRSKAEIEAILKQEGLVPGGTPTQAGDGKGQGLYAPAMPGTSSMSAVRGWQSDMNAPNAASSGGAPAQSAGKAGADKGDCSTPLARGRNVNC